MAQHHKVRILDEAVVDAVKLSSRYITGRQLPDKAVSVLDTACAKIAIGQNATPAELEDSRRRRDALAAERESLAREAGAGADHAKRLGEIDAESTQVNDRIATLEARWNQEKELVSVAIQQLDALDALAPDAPERKAAAEALNATRAQIKQLQARSRWCRRSSTARRWRR